MFLFPGTFMDTISILFVVAPFLDPFAASLGINPILYAVIHIELIVIAAVSPPF
jgi:TRAP-type C4-dicarboxylate transport system permease large subunit